MGTPYEDSERGILSRQFSQAIVREARDEALDWLHMTFESEPRGVGWTDLQLRIRQESEATQNLIVEVVTEFIDLAIASVGGYLTADDPNEFAVYAQLGADLVPLSDLTDGFTGEYLGQYAEELSAYDKHGHRKTAR